VAACHQTFLCFSVLLENGLTFYFCHSAIHVLKIAAVNEQQGEYKVEVERWGTV
jgi:hypothetical protein